MQILSTDGKASRTQQAILVGLVGLAVNFVLGGVKVFIGWQSGFLSVMGMASITSLIWARCSCS